MYDWDILGSSIYIVDILRIDDLRIDDQSSILRSSIYRVFGKTGGVNVEVEFVLDTDDVART